MFRRKKKVEQDYSYYDDYDYDDYDYDDYDYDYEEDDDYDYDYEEDDDYDYDDEYDYDDSYDDDEDYDYEEEYEEEVVIPTKKSSSGNSNIEAQLRKELEEKQREILTLKQEKADLDVQFASLQALPKHYQQLEEEQGSMIEKVNALENEKAELLVRVQHAENVASQYEGEIITKQAEIDNLADKLLNSTNDTDDSGRMEALLDELEMTKRDLQSTRSRLRQLEDSVPNYTKEDIAEVMLEAQAKARKIIDRANYDSKRIVVEAEKDLANIGQDARVHLERIRSVKEESTEIFDSLLSRLETIVELDRTREE